jgi:hypothetical protein
MSLNCVPESPSCASVLPFPECSEFGLITLFSSSSILEKRALGLGLGRPQSPLSARFSSIPAIQTSLNQNLTCKDPIFLIKIRKITQSNYINNDMPANFLFFFITDAKGRKKVHSKAMNLKKETAQWTFIT